MPEDLQSIKKNVRLLLTKYPKFRNPYLRKQSHVQYWLEFDGMGKFLAGILTKEYPKWTSPETLSRAIRAIQKEYPKLRPTPELERKKFEMANEHRDFFKGRT